MYHIQAIMLEYAKKMRSGGGVIDIKPLRQRLADIYSQFGLFGMNDIADASEALQALLQSAHTAFLGDISDGADSEMVDALCAPEFCPAHRVFWIPIMEQLICKCGATSAMTSWDNCTFFYPIYVDEFLPDTVGPNNPRFELSFRSKHETINS